MNLDGCIGGEPVGETRGFESVDDLSVTSGILCSVAFVRGIMLEGLWKKNRHEV